MTEADDRSRAVGALCDPATRPEVLRDIVRCHPDLRSAAAEHPAAPPDAPAAPPTSPSRPLTPVPPGPSPARPARWRRLRTALMAAAALALVAYAVVFALRYDGNRILSPAQFADCAQKLLPPAFGDDLVLVGPVEPPRLSPDPSSAYAAVSAGVALRIALLAGDERFPDTEPATTTRVEMPLLELHLVDSRSRAADFAERMARSWTRYDPSMRGTEQSADLRTADLDDVRVSRVGLTLSAQPDAVWTTYVAAYRNVVATSTPDGGFPSQHLDDWDVFAAGPFRDAVEEALTR